LCTFSIAMFSANPVQIQIFVPVILVNTFQQSTSLTMFNAFLLLKSEKIRGTVSIFEFEFYGRKCFLHADKLIIIVITI